MRRVLGETLVHVMGDPDVVTARQVGRELAQALRFNNVELTYIATAISEIARNIVEHAGSGEMRMFLVQEGPRRAIQVVAEDEGPGIEDVQRVLAGGYTTKRSLGVGVSGARRLMDDFHVESQIGLGTRITMSKWESTPMRRQARELV